MCKSGISNTKLGISEYKHVLANILRSRYVATTPPVEARSPDYRSNVEKAPRSKASNRQASRAHFPYMARNFENAPVTCQSPASSARRPRLYGRSHYVVISWDGRKLVTRVRVICCHSNATRVPIANPPNSAQLGGSLYHAPKLHPGPCSSVSVRPRTDRQTHRRA